MPVRSSSSSESSLVPLEAEAPFSLLVPSEEGPTAAAGVRYSCKCNV